jgi:hypothetical protein
MDLEDIGREDVDRIRLAQGGRSYEHSAELTGCTVGGVFRDQLSHHFVSQEGLCYTGAVVCDSFYSKSCDIRHWVIRKALLTRMLNYEHASCYVSSDEKGTDSAAGKTEHDIT